jgi:uncharacterized protein DUF6970
MKAIVIYGLILTMMGFCRKEGKNCGCLPGIPSCVQARIDEIKKEPKWNPPAEVNEYLYNGKTVYLFTADCCDQFITLVDANCNTICAPSGGITGGGDGRCPDFYEKAQHVRLVWKDSR